MLNSSFGLLHSEPFYILPKNKSGVPLLDVSTSHFTSSPKLTHSWCILTKTITSLDKSSKRNDTTLTPCFPWHSLKKLEASRSDVGDISFG